jgi:hypothetical protein
MIPSLLAAQVCGTLFLSFIILESFKREAKSS